MKPLYQQLVEVMQPEDIDHHNSDLYVRKTKESTRIINQFYIEHPELHKHMFVSTFKSNIPPRCLWYDIAFAYNPFWEGKKEHEEI